jgi:UDP-N-acetylmuramate dehydrogenase
MIGVLSKLEDVIGVGRIKQGELLAEHSVLKKGGLAQWYVELDKTEELIRLVREARKLDVPIFLFGSGAGYQLAPGYTSDHYFPGLVIKNACRRFDKASMKGTIRDNQVGVAEVLVSAEAGVIMNQLVRYTIEEGLEGLEYQLGIPGTVGGAIYTNARYKPKNILARSHLYSLRILDTDGQVQMFTGDLPHFVSMDEEWETKEIILSAVFKLVPYDKKILWGRGQEAVEFRNKGLGLGDRE